jgi:hypothetical protein
MPPKTSLQRASKRSGTDQQDAAKLLAAFLAETEEASQWNLPKVAEVASGKTIAQANPDTQMAVALAAAARFCRLAKKVKKDDLNIHFHDDYSAGSVAVLRFLFRRKLPFTSDALAEITELHGAFHLLFIDTMPHLEGLVRTIEEHATENGVSPRLAKALHPIKDGLGRVGNTPESRLRGRIVQVLKRSASQSKPTLRRLPIRISAKGSGTQKPSTFEGMKHNYVPPGTERASAFVRFQYRPIDPDVRNIERLNELFRSCLMNRELGWSRSRLRRAFSNLTAAERAQLLRVTFAAAAVLSQNRIPYNFDEEDFRGLSFYNATEACQGLLLDLLNGELRLTEEDMPIWRSQAVITEMFRP